MVGIYCEQEESWVSSRNLNLDQETQIHSHVTSLDQEHVSFDQEDVSFDHETEDIWQKVNQSKTSHNSTITPTNSFNSNSKKKKNQVLLEGYVEVASSNEDDDLKRTKSLTDDDLDELKGCLDLGFGFSYEEIPELCNTLPALELCYSMSQKFLDEQHKSPERSTSPAVTEPASSPIANWKISSPGDHPEDVKARLKFWAQAVACTVRLCS